MTTTTNQIGTSVCFGAEAAAIVGATAFAYLGFPYFAAAFAVLAVGLAAYRYVSEVM